MKFNMIRRNKISNIDIVLIVLIVVFGLLPFFDLAIFDRKTVEFRLVMIIGLFGFFFCIIILGLKKRYNKIGVLELKSDKISINLNESTDDYLFEEIQDLKIYFTGYEGETIPLNSLFGYLSWKTGIDNYIQFNYNRTLVKYEFLVRRKGFVQNIKQLWGNRSEVKFKIIKMPNSKIIFEKN
ncbi:MAG: hypothetical protein A2W91_06730 [Bacteroidetes bacterium GWF2_38_335]|nr:MAG: hypothetical protein A2W91_06730 [Bacteroidetes bacterium GWF2_38_335]OFY79853.1 MAG: hypothetical protein A2281_09350 [Bacteroidetes bacterium RIFOXYA12_FULL_38_20]HBS84911.1 hypothetical protein [Bacteroidales bacterium]